MQVNLKDLVSLDEETMLPENGILLFFYEAETQPWGPELGEVFIFPVTVVDLDTFGLYNLI